MATYANPYAKGKPIRTKGRLLAKGITRMANGFAKDRAAKKAKQQRDTDEAQNLLDRRTSAFESNLWTGYDGFQDQLTEFGDGMSKENKDHFKGQIVNMLKGMREETSDWIRDNPEATDTDLRQKQQESLDALAQFKTDLTHLNIAREQYDKAKNIPTGQPGSLVTSFNPHLIKMFEAIERNDPNLQLTLDDGGSFRMSVINEEQLGDALNTMGDDDLLEFSSMDLTKWGKSAEEGGGYFQFVEEPDYTEFDDMIVEEIKKGNTEFGTWDSKNQTVASFNKDNIKDFYTGGGSYSDPKTNGVAILNSFGQDQNAVGNFMYYGADVIDEKGDGFQTKWNRNANDYTPEGYVQEHLQGYLNSLPDTKPKSTKITSNTTNTPSPTSGFDPQGYKKKTKKQKVQEQKDKEEKARLELKRQKQEQTGVKPMSTTATNTAPQK